MWRSDSKVTGIRLAYTMNTTVRGDAFENTIYNLLEQQVTSDRFFAKRECCRIFKKKGYYSKDRQGEIVFDVSIEISLPGADTFSLLVLIECKDYTSKVPVNDIEEFWAKVSQVAAANVKAVFASTTAFQDGALKFAESKGFGVIRYFAASEFKWVLKRSASWAGSDGVPQTGNVSREALTAESFASNYYDCCFFAKRVRTYSSNRMFQVLCLQGDQRLPEFISIISNSNQQARPLVPYIERGDIEQSAARILSVSGYSDGPANLELIAEQQRAERGLAVHHHVAKSVDGMTLGSLSFDPLLIEIFDCQGHPGRTRFTLAHELGHLLLDHGRFMTGELTVESDFDRDRHRSLSFVDVRRMEWQANCFASCILLPLGPFMAHLFTLADQLELRDRGFGLLYVDEQPVNVQSFMRVTNHICGAFKASRQAVVIRLTQLGYLNDVRDEIGLTRVL
jgi:hypothetical protein